MVLHGCCARGSLEQTERRSYAGSTLEVRWKLATRRQATSATEVPPAAGAGDKVSFPGAAARLGPALEYCIPCFPPEAQAKQPNACVVFPCVDTLLIPANPLGINILY